MPVTIAIDSQSALGLGAFGGGWSPGTALDISAQAQVQITLNRDTNILRIQTESPVHVLFNTTDGTTNTVANDPVYPTGVHEIPVPRGLYSTEKDGAQNKNVIYCHLKQETSAADKTLRFVES